MWNILYLPFQIGPFLTNFQFSFLEFMGTGNVEKKRSNLKTNSLILFRSSKIYKDFYYVSVLQIENHIITFQTELLDSKEFFKNQKKVFP